MKKNLLLLVSFLTFSTQMFSQTIAQKRNKSLGIGTNLSYLDNYWNANYNTRIDKHYGDFANWTEINKRKSMFADIAKVGMKTVRIPVCYGAWATVTEPYKWDFPESLPMADSLISWALQNKLNVAIDLHHTEFDGSIPNSATTKRIVWLWSQIANRYKNLDPERVFFELRNEPHDMTADVWRTQAVELISTVRKIAPNHTMIVGAEDWNGLDALAKMKPFDDNNIIYTFHFYDPFIFTHQGATWAGDGLNDLRGVEFPYVSKNIIVPAKSAGTWIADAIKNYPNEGTVSAIVNRFNKAKKWSDDNNKLPIFCGEFGSYNLISDAQSRCNHAQAIYTVMGLLEIPGTWWEWDGGFTMLNNNNSLTPCMQQALNTYDVNRVLGNQSLIDNSTLEVYPNPTKDSFNIKLPNIEIKSYEIMDFTGKLLVNQEVTDSKVSITNLSDGLYILKLFDKKGALVGFKKVMKY
jgi:endoglucanase